MCAAAIVMAVLAYAVPHVLFSFKKDERSNTPTSSPQEMPLDLPATQVSEPGQLRTGSKTRIEAGKKIAGAKNSNAR
jgi:hypothetical protein